MISDILSENQINSILNNKDVIIARKECAIKSQVYFNIELSNEIKNSIKQKLGIDLLNKQYIPMRWIKGDLPRHIDKGDNVFQNTYLIYVTDSIGNFIIEDSTFPIKKGNGIIFQEGVYHETKDTGDIPRLIIGPMSELGLQVGASVTFYYPTETDAKNNTNQLANYGDYTIFTVSDISKWRLADNSTGSSNKSIVYNTGDELNPAEFYYLYPAFHCFLEDSTILCLIETGGESKEMYVPIQNICRGTLVKTANNGYKKVELIKSSTIYNPKSNDRTVNKLYICKKDIYKELTHDLIITGAHSILVDNITNEQREKMTKILGKIFITGNKYRLIACADEKAEIWNNEGKHNIWHIALESSNIFINFGIYANGGLLVETSCIMALR